LYKKVLLAEIIKHYIPSIVDVHNYPSASSTQGKVTNWTTLNGKYIINPAKVLKKLGINLKKQDIDDIIALKPMAVEKLLIRVKDRVNKFGKQLENNPMENATNLSQMLQNPNNRSEEINNNDNKMV
jgi:hypothetical protein